jgi:hypothetical protein
MKDLARSFQKIVDSTFVNIDGILVQRGVNRNGEEGFMWGGVFCKDIEEVRKVRDSAIQIIKTSLVDNKK